MYSKNCLELSKRKVDGSKNILLPSKRNLLPSKNVLEPYSKLLKHKIHEKTVCLDPNMQPC